MTYTINPDTMYKDLEAILDCFLVLQERAFYKELPEWGETQEATRLHDAAEELKFWARARKFDKVR